MTRLVALLACLVALLFGRTSEACENATLADDPVYRRLRDANEALDENDVRRARELAEPVAGGSVRARYLPEASIARAQRLVAIAWVRDRDAGPDAIDRAVATLEEHANHQAVTDPVLEAELGEAYARAGKYDAAYAKLSPLSERDLLGSPHAWAALSRAAAKRGDAATASRATARCSQITSSQAICRGDYPPPPLLRGKTAGYALPGLVAAIALALRRRRRPPWSSYGERMFAAIVLATSAFVFAYARQPATTTLVTLAVVIAVGITQHVAFVSAVKRGRIEEWLLREATVEDAGLPRIASFFHAHSGELVLERVSDPSYREPARVAVTRLSARPRRTIVVVGTVVMLALFFAACASTMMLGARG